MTSGMGEQMTLQDLGMPYTKMYPAHSQATKAMTSAVSSRNSAKSSKKMPMFLNLQKRDGTTQEASSWTEGLWLGDLQMHSIGAFHSAENGCVYSVTSTDTPQKTFSLHLNTGEHPREAMPTILSDILEEETDSRYNLSSRACKGILNRAEKRGKQLPEILKQALEIQANDTEA